MLSLLLLLSLSSSLISSLSLLDYPTRTAPTVRMVFPMSPCGSTLCMQGVFYHCHHHHHHHHYYHQYYHYHQYQHYHHYHHHLPQEPTLCVCRASYCWMIKHLRFYIFIHLIFLIFHTFDIPHFLILLLLAWAAISASSSWPSYFPASKVPPRLKKFHLWSEYILVWASQLVQRCLTESQHLKIYPDHCYSSHVVGDS